MYNEILDIKNSFTDEKRQNSLAGAKKLLELCAVEANDPNNYYNKFVK